MAEHFHNWIENDPSQLHIGVIAPPIAHNFMSLSFWMVHLTFKYVLSFLSLQHTLLSHLPFEWFIWHSSMFYPSSLSTQWLSQGERLSHAVGCAFAACLERKQQRDKLCGVKVEFDVNKTSFTRQGSFRVTTMTEAMEAADVNTTEEKENEGIKLIWVICSVKRCRMKQVSQDIITL